MQYFVNIVLESVCFIIVTLVVLLSRLGWLIMGGQRWKILENILRVFHTIFHLVNRKEIQYYFCRWSAPTISWCSASSSEGRIAKYIFFNTVLYFEGCEKDACSCSVMFLDWYEVHKQIHWQVRQNFPIKLERTYSWH
jgi:hypothetical protein